MADFTSIAKKKMGDIERPPLPPAGIYRMQVKEQPKFGEIESDKGAWSTLDIQLQAVEGVTVDPKELKAYGDPKNIVMTHRFMIDKEAPDNDAGVQRTEYNIRRFFEEHLQCAKPTDSLAEAMNNSVGAQCLAEIIWKPDRTDPELFHANIRRTSPRE